MRMRSRYLGVRGCLGRRRVGEENGRRPMLGSAASLGGDWEFPRPLSGVLVCLVLPLACLPVPPLGS